MNISGLERWKVLLADDESIIRQGIRSSIPWEELQMDVIGEAEDGEEALELAVQGDADLLLVDLNMPIMNGITLIKELREKLPACRVVIITGHEEFSYAQEAIRLGVDDYILKPIDVGQLVKALREVRKQLESDLQQQKHQEHLELANRQIAKNVMLLRERFCLEWIEGELPEDQIREQLRFLQLPEKAPEMLGVIRWPELNMGKPIIRENDRQLLLFAIENIASEVLESDGVRHLIVRDRFGLILICAWDLVPEASLSKVEQAVATYLKLTICHQTVPVRGFTGIPAAYQEARREVYKDVQISPFVRRGKQEAQEHYADPDLSLEKLAERLQVSPVYFGRLFKQETGVSFVHFLTQTRMKRAIQLLHSTDMTILEIAEKVGYYSQHYFSTSFKKMMGVSPNQYRRGVLTGVTSGAEEE